MLSLALNTNQSKGLSWPWSYGSWIYNYLCNQCLSPLMLWVRLPLRARCLCAKVCQWLAAGLWFSPGTLVSSTNKTDRHDIAEILLKVSLNTIKPNQTNQLIYSSLISIFFSYWWTFSALDYGWNIYCWTLSDH